MKSCTGSPPPAQGMDVAAIAKVAFTSEDRVRDVIGGYAARCVPAAGVLAAAVTRAASSSRLGPGGVGGRQPLA
jgi:hypothetical protein